MSRPAIVDFATFDNQFRGNSICCQSTIYTSCVKLNNLQFIGKMRLAGQKTLNPLFWARTRCQVSKLLLLRFVFPVARLIKMDLMLGLIFCVDDSIRSTDIIIVIEQNCFQQYCKLKKRLLDLYKVAFLSDPSRIIVCH